MYQADTLYSFILFLIIRKLMLTGACKNGIKYLRCKIQIVFSIKYAYLLKHVRKYWNIEFNVSSLGRWTMFPSLVLTVAGGITTGRINIVVRWSSLLLILCVLISDCVEAAPIYFRHNTPDFDLSVDISYLPPGHCHQSRIMWAKSVRTSEQLIQRFPYGVYSDKNMQVGLSFLVNERCPVMSAGHRSNFLQV